MNEKRCIRVKDEYGAFVLQIPADARITFGPAIPAPRTERMMRGGGHDVYALRIYKGATEKSGLLAVFPGVFYFHDIEDVAISRPQLHDGKTHMVPDNGWFDARNETAAKLAQS
jgi:hypothetical protein